MRSRPFALTCFVLSLSACGSFTGLVGEGVDGGTLQDSGAIPDSTSMNDGGTKDAAPPQDTGAPGDSGTQDASPTDSGPADAGSDTGTADAGPPPPCTGLRIVGLNALTEDTSQGSLALVDLFQGSFDAVLAPRVLGAKAFYAAPQVNSRQCVSFNLTGTTPAPLKAPVNLVRTGVLGPTLDLTDASALELVDGSNHTSFGIVAFPIHVEMGLSAVSNNKATATIFLRGGGVSATFVHTVNYRGNNMELGAGCTGLSCVAAKVSFANAAFYQ